MKKLDRIKIENFKSIRSLDLELSSLNVFIGANGSGKSNFIGLFKFLNKLISGQLRTYVAGTGGADSILYYGKKQSDTLSVSLSFGNMTNGYDCVLMSTKDDNLYFWVENVWYHDKTYPSPYTDYIGSGHSESLLNEFVQNRKSRISYYVLNELQQWRLYHFHDTSDSAKVKLTCDLHDNRELRPDAGNLAAYLFYLKEKHPQHFRNIEDTIRLAAPFFKRFILEPSKLNPEKILLEWKEIGSDKYFNASSLSDGTLRFICLTTLLMQPELPSVILLDEPELGLHPSAITLLASLLKSASEKTQVLVATQSVTLVNQFEPDHIIVVEREGGQSVFKHLSDEDMSEWLQDFGLGELWEKNIFGGRP